VARRSRVGGRFSPAVTTLRHVLSMHPGVHSRVKWECHDTNAGLPSVRALAQANALLTRISWMVPIHSPPRSGTIGRALCPGAALPCSHRVV
jgi:hypothetical protein